MICLSFYTYIGAFIWTGTFIYLGKVLGPQWEHFHISLKKYLLIGSVMVIILFVIIYILKKVQIKNQGNDYGWSR
ncbi:MAG: hypothetical protein WAM95_19110 [Bacillus sp. (in: firmicutes)]